MLSFVQYLWTYSWDYFFAILITEVRKWQLRHATKKSERAYRMYIDKLETRLATERAITARKLQEAKQDLRTNEKQYMEVPRFSGQ